MNDHRGTSSGRLLLASVAINFAVGALYGWGVFLKALEESLHADRSVISIAPSLALAMFTVGALLHNRLLRSIPARRFALLSCVLAALGHLLFAVHPSVTTLLIGYGGIYGLSAGLCYGLALALASWSSANQRNKGMAIGIATTSFAATGLVMSLGGTWVLRSITPGQAFALIGAFQMVVGVVSFMLIGGASASASIRSTTPLNFQLRDAYFIGLLTSFAIICLVGLMTVSHSTGLLADRHASDLAIGFAPLIVNLGYIGGGITGGAVTGSVSIGRALLSMSILLALGVSGLALFHSPSMSIAGLALIGAALGASAAVYPIAIGRRYGAENIGAIYGKVLVAYGVSGLVAPWLTGSLYVRTGGYTWPLLIALALGLSGIAITAAMTRHAESPSDR
jgi:MFS family permease